MEITCARDADMAWWPQRPAHKNRVAFLPVAEGGEAILSGRLSIYRGTCSTSWRACP